MSYQMWFAYMLACWVISISPGAGAIASMSSGLNYGFKRGYWNAIGLQLALVVQIGIVAAGAGVLLATSPWAFLVIKWFGVGYLLYLAYLQWKAPVQSIEIAVDAKQKSIPKLIMYGFLVNMSNPKAIVFLLAVLPQFLDLSQPQWPQYLIKGYARFLEMSKEQTYPFGTLKDNKGNTISRKRYGYSADAAKSFAGKRLKEL